MGILDPLPRTPRVFEEQVKWPLENSPCMRVGEGDHAGHEETLPSSCETFPLNHPEGPRVLGGTGPPRFCRQLGGGKPFHDGGGLCSPGRYHARSYADGPQWEWLRKRTLEVILAKVGSLEQLEKEAFRMAAGGEKGCTLASKWRPT